MGEIVNLNKARKARARAGAEQTAAENRAKFGRTKAARKAEAEAAARVSRTLDGARRDRAGDDAETGEDAS